jgi:hypothetical protein
MMTGKSSNTKEEHVTDKEKAEYYKAKVKAQGYELQDLRLKLERATRKAGAHKKNIREMQNKLRILNLLVNQVKVG